MCFTTARSCAMNRYESPSRALQILQQVYHLRLDRNIQRRDRFVAHHQRRLNRQRPRNSDTR